MFKEYDQYDATGLAGLIAKSEVSASEIFDAALAKIDSGEPKINAIAEDLRERAKASLTMQPSGPFAGVPFLLKDYGQELEGARNTRGCIALSDEICAHSSEVTKRFQKTGLVILGTTTTPELALKATTETALHGVTRNPWDLERSPGGSSGGTAAAVAAGYVPMAGASDGGGSIRIPSAFCGLFGLKPSRGRVPSGPDQAEGWDGASVEHVLTRSVRDSAIMLDALSAADAGAPFDIAPPERNFAEEVGAPVEPLRIGFSTASFIGGRVEPEQIKAVQNAMKLLQGLGHHVEEAAPKIDGEMLINCYMTMYYGQVAASVKKICADTGKPESSFEVDTRVIALLGRTVTAGEYVQARLNWNTLARAKAAFHDRYDLLVTPVTAFGPSKIGELQTSATEQRIAEILIKLNAGKLLIKSGISQKAAFKGLERCPFTQYSNLTSTPAMSVPLHWGADGLPVGVQFMAKFGAEGLLFRLAAQLEQAQPWAGRRPQMIS